MDLSAHASAVVVKIGGSLYDWPQLGSRLRSWLHHLDTQHVLLVPGGGPTVEALRDLDRRHHLGEEAAHWLALRALLVNAHFLQALLPSSVVVAGWQACPGLWERRQIPILDVHSFAVADEDALGALPHTWQVTSDSIAARVAAVGGAQRVILLKSVDHPGSTDWDTAASCGIVDEWFGRMTASGTRAEVVNLRGWSG